VAGGNEREEGETDAVLSEDWESRGMSLLRRRRMRQTDGSRLEYSRLARMEWIAGTATATTHARQDKTSLSLSRAVDAASASLVL
jgi:hypothetical protein